MGIRLFLLIALFLPQLRESTDPIVPQQWALRAINASAAWEYTTGAPITIAVLDTGVSRSHPDLRGRVLRGYDFVNNDADASDDEGHGTYVAGVIAADGANGIGIAGVCWNCLILPVKVLDETGRSNDDIIAAGIRWAADQGAQIISMSLGGIRDTAVLRDAVAYARERGALLVAASGNSQSRGNPISYPAAYPGVLAVAATDGTTVTGFSTTGDFVDMAAPGVGIWSTVWDRKERDTYAALNGTSAACPYVAGAAALVMSLRPDLTPDQVAALLMRTADDRGAPGKDPEFGYGFLDLGKAVRQAADPALNPAELVEPTATTADPGGVSGYFAPVGAPAAGARYFRETGHTLSGEFRVYWERHGGLPIFGLPISEPFVERGEDGRDYLVQYFERHRFEYHPELKPPYNVLLSRLGATTIERSGRNWQEFGKSPNLPNCRYFPETGQSICGEFLAYWRSHGLELDGRRGFSEAESLALFGLPLSAPQIERLSNGQSYMVQWFERARMEDHGADGVLLGLLSSELVQSRGWR